MAGRRRRGEDDMPVMRKERMSAEKGSMDRGVLEGIWFAGGGLRVAGIESDAVVTVE